AATKRDSAAAAVRQANVAAVASSAANGAGARHTNGHRPARVATSPAIRRRAHEAGVDLRMVAGSGPHGRIVRQDFDAYVQKRSAKGAPDKPTPLRPRPADGGVSSPGRD